MSERRQAFKEPGYRGKVRVSTEDNHNGLGNGKPNHGPLASGTLKIEVEDNGIGVKEEDFKKLFTPFLPPRSPDIKALAWGCM